MVEPADLRAVAWIDSHTPIGSRFLINGFFPNPEAVVGSDAGWWLPMLAHRPTTLPPLLYIAEQEPRPDYRQWINHLYATIYGKGINHPDSLALLRERGIAYIYIGQLRGKGGYNGTVMMLNPEILQSSRYFQSVYHDEDIWIFKLQANYDLGYTVNSLG